MVTGKGVVQLLTPLSANPSCCHLLLGRLSVPGEIHMSDYKTVAGTSHDTIYEKKSEFIGYISHAKTEADARAFLAQVRKKHYDARHACYGYIIKDEKIERQSDDGEPQKTAGMPILEVIRHSGLEDVIVVVVRYFGGTLLGTGGLVRAYTRAAQAAVASAEILSYSLCVDLSIEIDYSLYDKLMNICANLGRKIMDTQYTDKVYVTMRMISGTQQALIKEIELLTKGRQPQVSREIYDIF